MVAKIELSKGVGDEGGITLDVVRSFINANKENELLFEIDTLGGDLNAALTIHNLIKLHAKKTTARIIGMTASAGTVIAEACDEVEMFDNTLFLIHNGLMKAYGNKYELQTAVNDLDKNDKIMEGIYCNRTGLDAVTIANIMKQGDWMTAAEAAEYGFVDKVIPANMKIAASVVLNSAKIHNLNQVIIQKLESKMNIFNKKNPVKAEVLPDGEYTLDSGQKIVVKGGITETVPAEAAKPAEEAPAAAEANTAELVAAVTAVVNEAITANKAEIMAEVKAQIDALTKAHGDHKPAKGTVSANAKVENPIEAAHKAVKEFTTGIRKGIVESRKS